MWWIAAALAGDLEPSVEITLPATASVVLADGDVWLIAGDEGASWVDDAGAVTAVSTRPVVAAALVDVGADTPDLVLCGPDGLWLAPAEVWVSSTPCTAVVSNGSGWTAILDGTAWSWAGAASDPMDVVPGVLWDDPVLAAGPGRVLIAERGASQATEIAAGRSSIAVGGGLLAAAWDERWWLGFSPADVRALGGSAFDVGDPPSQLLPTDLDGDGARDVVVLGDTVDVFSEDGAPLFGVVAADPVAMVDGERLAVLTDGGATLSLYPVDADGDAWLDDCDDRDPAVHPGAPERCNSVDDDCDGEIDESQLSLRMPAHVGEGEPFTIGATADGCVTEPPYVTTEATNVECTRVDEATFTCLGLDDGGVDVFVVSGEDTTSFRVIVDNVAPQWVEVGFLDAATGVVDVSRWVSDPGQDTLTFSAENLPFGAIMAADGTLTLTDINTSPVLVTFIATDDDGGIGSTVVELTVIDETGRPFSDTGSGGIRGGPVCSGCTGLFCLLGPLAFVGLLLGRRA